MRRSPDLMATIDVVSISSVTIEARMAGGLMAVSAAEAKLKKMPGVEMINQTRIVRSENAFVFKVVMSRDCTALNIASVFTFLRDLPNTRF